MPSDYTPEQLREIDALIAEARGWRRGSVSIHPWLNRSDGYVFTPTTNIADAMTLVSGWNFNFIGAEDAPRFRVELWSGSEWFGQEWGETLPLAISLAYCRAKGIQLPEASHAE